MGREPEESRETAAAVPSASHASSVQDVPNMPPHGDIVSLMSRTLGAANRYLVELMAREGLAGIVPSHGDPSPILQADPSVFVRCSQHHVR